MTAPATYHGRRAAQIENESLRVTVLEEGGHIAEILDKRTGMNPLWTPPWRSIEPSAFDRSSHRDYGDGIDAPLLAGIMGHNLCLDIFGAPSPEEYAAGMPVHGEASTVRYDLHLRSSDALLMRAELRLAGLQFERRIEVSGSVVRIRERVENRGSIDKPIGWTQHVTLGPPFLEKGVTQFRASATRSKVFEKTFGTADYLRAGAEFQWPMAPREDGGSIDLRTFTNAAASSAYTAHLMDPGREHAYFVAFNPGSRLAFGYVWRRAEFPWMGIWEENHSRAQRPWNGETLTRGMEFGVSPFPESRRAMVERARLFDVPAFGWVSARSAVTADYYVAIREVDSIFDTLEWPA